LQGDGTGGHPIQHERVENVLLNEHPLGKSVNRIVLEHGNGSLRDYRPGIEIARYEMNRTAMYPNTLG
jgi:hypothetical protein